MPLKLYLQAQVTEDVPMSFAEFESVLGLRLPASAYRHRAWWANETRGHVHAQAWLDAGYEATQVDMAEGNLIFRRVKPLPGAPPVSPAANGLSDQGRSYFVADAASPRPRHPAFGALKGTFTVAPGYDLTNPMFGETEWAAVETEMAADWERIEQGLKGQT